MAKQTQTPVETNPTTQANPTSGVDASNGTSSRKKRTPGVKYKQRIVTKPHGPTDNPLDKPAIPHRGGFKFPGVICDNTLAGMVLKIPAKGAYAVNPSIREVFTILQDLFDKKPESE